MASKILFVLFVVVCVAVVQITGQGCRPGAVQNIRVDQSLLVWEPPRNNSCFISYFMVYIYHELGETTHTYHTGRTSLVLNFLKVCENYYFNITPVSGDDLVGVETEHYARVPFPQTANLRIEAFSISQRDTGVHLEWVVADEWTKCADRYRVSVIDEQSDSAVDLYVYSTSTTITGLVACSSYVLGVRAIYNLEKEGPYTSTRYAAPPAIISAPKLQSINAGSTSIDLTWQLESYSLNRCPISSLTVDASPYFKTTYPYVANQAVRPPLSVPLRDLEPDTMYLLNVTLTNNAGTSAPVLVAVQTLQSA